MGEVMDRNTMWFSGGCVVWDAELRDYRATTDNEPTNVILYMLRHGTTALNADNKFRGWMNASLDDKGKKDAKDAAKFLLGRGIVKIYCSDLDRSEETAAIVGEALGLNPLFDDQLRGWNLGELAGKDKDEYHDQLEDYIDHPNKQIPGGESLKEFGNRMQEVLDEYFDEARIDGPILLICHTSNVIQLYNYCEGTGATGRPESDEAIKPGGVIAVSEVGGELKPEAILKDAKREAEYGS
jgi:broad specificity phosphatase PhoE